MLGRHLSLAFLLALPLLVGTAPDAAGADLSQFKAGGSYRIREVIDLEGGTWTLPPDVTLTLDGGMIRNGVLEGNRTKLSCRGVGFDRVHITGSWIAPTISTAQFADLSYDNALQDVFALASPEVKNTITVGPGTYRITLTGGYGIGIFSQSDVTLDGDIVLTPNALTAFNSILYLSGERIRLKGSGSITGDKHSHLGDEGEWGMGITIDGGRDVSIKGLTVKDCWGDCIFVGGGSEGVNIKGCVLDHGRRQGISIVSATNVQVSNCLITNVGGIAPEYAIDIEPDAGNTVDRVRISNLRTSNCRGGIMSFGRAPEAMVGTIEISNCVIEGGELCPMYFQKGLSVSVRNTRIEDSGATFTIICDDIDSARITGNTISGCRKVMKNREVTVMNAKMQKVKSNIVR